MTVLLNPFVYPTPTLATGDPYWNNVVLLVGANGADASTAFVDESLIAHTLTAAGNAQIDTAQFRYGTASMLLDGTGDYVTSADIPDWDLGAAPFTIEGWFRFNAHSGNVGLISQWNSTGTTSWAFWFSSTNFTFRAVDTGGTTRDATLVTFSPTLNTWYHLAVDRDGSGNLRLYVDGIMHSKTTGYTHNIRGGDQPLDIGRVRGSAFDMNGWIDELRITKGVARYASDSGYLVPPAAFPRVPTLILDPYSPSGAWSMSRDLLIAASGLPRYTTATGINSIKDQTGGLRHLANTSNQPVVATAGPNSRTCADFNGTTQILQTAASVSSFWSNTTGYVVCSFLVDGITGSDTVDLFFNDLVWGDGINGYSGIYLTASGTPAKMTAFGYDGNNDFASQDVVVTGTAYVAEWRHEGGNLYLRVNGGTEVSVAHGTASDMSGPLGIGDHANIKFFEMATFATIPSSTNRDIIAADFKSHIGI
jgi:hypothetical protein